MARAPLTRGLRDEADVGPDPHPARELRRLSELRYRVADGEPDVRGWTVYSSTGRELGTVSDLLVDAEAGEVVMLDVDLKRGDRHTLAPIRAAWIDHATRRVVLDARAAEQAMTAGAGPGAGTAAGVAAGTAAGAAAARPAPDVDDDAGLPMLPRGGALSDDDVRRFDADYARAYGERGVDAERAYRLRRGDEELRFAAGPRRLLDASTPGSSAPAGGVAGAAGAAAAGGAAFAESDRINSTLAAPDVAAARREAATHTDERLAGTGLGTTPPAGDAARARAPLADGLPVERTRHATAADGGLAAAAAAADARFAEPAERRLAREDRAEDARLLDDAQGIDPRELDGRVRIDEGGTVDDRTPVAGVRYDEGAGVPHSYGQPADAYGAEYGSGRIGFDRVVSRHPYAAGERGAEATRPATDEELVDRPVRYRRYPDAPTGDAR